MSFRFTMTQPVRWKDIDAAGVLNNAVYLTLVEQARYRYFEGLGLLEGAADFSFLLGETTARYLAPGKAGMTLDVRARTSRMGGKSFDQEYELACGEQVLCRVSARLVWCDAELRSSVIPEDVRRRIAEYEGIPERQDAS